MYELDGKTVVGEFFISFDSNDIVENEDNSKARGTSYAYSTEYPIECSGYKFYVKSGIKNATNGVRGISCIRATKAAPVGYMGAKARIIRYSDSALVRETNWYYNSSQQTSFSVDGYYFTISGQQFYAQGYTREFNTSINDYWTHVTNKSPHVTS